MDSLQRMLQGKLVECERLLYKLLERFLPDEREWTLRAEDGVWRVVTGAGSPYTLGEEVVVVPKAELERALLVSGMGRTEAYREVLERIGYAQEFPGDEKAALEGCRSAAREVLKAHVGGKSE